MNRNLFYRRRPDVLCLYRHGSVLAIVIMPALIAILIAAVGGCGSGTQRASLSGQITFDGAPLATGVISLEPTGGTKGPSAGAEIAAGKYQIAANRGPLPGRYRVSITANRKTGRDVVVGGIKGAESEQFIPANYNVKTELEVEIKPGRNAADFTLTSGK
jgi:hypothetical protein